MRMAMRHGVTAASLLALLAPAAMAKEPLVLKPSSPWHVDYDRDSCVLARTFGQADELVSLRFEQFAPGHVYQVSTVGRPFRTSALNKKVALTLGKGGLEREVTAMAGSSQDGRPAMTFQLHLAHRLGDGEDQWRGLQAEEEAAIDQIGIGWKSPGAELVLATGPFDKPLQAMRTCMDELLTHWGIDPAKHKTLAKPAMPKTNPAGWASSDDYPKSAAFQGQSALVHFRLTVGPDGRVKDCSIQNATKGEEFATQTCRLISQRGRFSPAIDAEGNPIASYYVNTVRWQMGR